MNGALEVWAYEDKRVPILGMTAVIGRTASEVSPTQSNIRRWRPVVTM